MGWKFNPFTGTLDEVGASGGGGSPGGNIYDVQLNDGAGGFSGSDNLNFQGGYLTINGDSGYGQLQWLNEPITGGYGGSGINGTDDEIIVGALAGDLSIWASQAMSFSADAGGTNMFQVNTNGSITIADLGGGGTKMVVTDNSGVLSTQSIPGLAIGETVTSGTAGSVLYIDGSGNLAQDNTNFSYTASAKRLDINGPIRFGSGAYFIGNSSNGFVINNHADTLNLVQFYPSGGGAIGQDYANNGHDPGANNFIVEGIVGIGTPSPNQQLEITKNFRLPESTTTAGLIYQGTNLLLHTYAGTAGVVNTFLGVGAGNLTNTSGGGSGRNTGVGKNAMHGLADGYQNTTVGELAGSAITDGYSNTLIGYQTGWLITTGFGNTGIGTQALTAVTTGADNNAFGYKALGALTSGASNLGFGYNSNPTVTSGNENVAIGDNAMNGLTTGNNNVVVGAESLKGGNVSDNVVMGYNSMNRVTTASHNVAIGMETFYAMTTGLYNTALGYIAGSYIDDVTTGQNNTFLGAKTSFPNSTQHNYATVIGADGVVAASNAMVFGGPDTGGAEVNASIGITAPLARLHLPPGRAAANKAPLKFSSGVNLTTPEDGTWEYDGTDFFYTTSGTRHTLSSGGGSTSPDYSSIMTFSGM